MDSSTTTLKSISNSRVSSQFLLLLYLIEIPVFNANSVDTDQTPDSAASDLDLRCLPIIFWGFPTKMGYGNATLHQRH